MILLKNSIFYDIPKTGCSWVAEGLVYTGMGQFIEKTSHRPPKKSDKKKHGKKYTFTFVRNPVDWYRSFYASRVDKKLAEPFKFYEFLIEMYSGMEIFGRKWTTLKDYLKPFMKCDFVGRTENLRLDLKKAMEMFDERMEGNLLDRPKVNVSNYKVGPDKESIKLIKRMEI